jgi:hypothetical protein
MRILDRVPLTCGLEKKGMIPGLYESYGILMYSTLRLFYISVQVYFVSYADPSFREGINFCGTRWAFPRVRANKLSKLGQNNSRLEWMLGTK